MKKKKLPGFSMKIFQKPVLLYTNHCCSFFPSILWYQKLPKYHTWENFGFFPIVFVQKVTIFPKKKHILNALVELKVLLFGFSEENQS
jgi:hypothetical protein